MRTFMIVSTLTSLLVNCCQGQQQDLFGAPQFQPVPVNRGAASVVDFENLAMAKFDEKDGQPHLVFLVQQYRTEKREVQVTKFRTEQRTRRVKVVRPNGEDQEVEQTYTVNVPYAETMEANVPTPAGEKPVGVSFEKLKLFRLDATPVAPEEAAELLKTLQPVFVGVMGNGDFTAPAEIIQKALNPKTLVVLTDEVQLRRPDLRGIPVDIPLPRPLAR